MFGCDASERSAQLFPELVASPAKQISGEPNLVVGEDGNTYLSWIEKSDGEYHALRYAEFNGDSWSLPSTVTEGKNWFVNWADIPSLAVLDDGTITAHWLERSDTLRYSYDVKIGQSVDGRNTWTSPVTPHRDGTRTEHGFVSMLPWSDGRVLAVWLDGRNFANEKKDEVFRNMTLRAAVVDREGRLSDEVELTHAFANAVARRQSKQPAALSWPIEIDLKLMFGIFPWYGGTMVIGRRPTRCIRMAGKSMVARSTAPPSQRTANGFLRPGLQPLRTAHASRLFCPTMKGRPFRPPFVSMTVIP